MDYEKIIAALQRKLIGGVIVTDKEGHELYRDSNVEVTEDFFKQCVEACPVADTKGTVSIWEFWDTQPQRFYQIQSAVSVLDGKSYQVHQITDISENIRTYQMVNQYSSELKEIMQFQSEMFQKLSVDFDSLLYILKDYFHAAEVVLYIQRDKMTEKMVCADEFARETVTDSVLMEKLFGMKNGEQMGNYICFTNNKIADSQYAVLLNFEGNDEEAFRNLMLEDNIRLYIENAVLRDKTIYESEHDHMTGLYNKGKYMQLMSDFFPTKQTVAIFNMDVNNLKQMNDNYGHEAGDSLLVKAAESIRMVVSENVYGFRMGGDEYLMIAFDIPLEEANHLKSEWEKCLSQLNERDDGINCVIACGMAYGSGEEIDILLKAADERMYEDKRNKKKPGEEIR